MNRFSKCSEQDFHLGPSHCRSNTLTMQPCYLPVVVLDFQVNGVPILPDPKKMREPGLKKFFSAMQALGHFCTILDTGLSLRFQVAG